MMESSEIRHISEDIINKLLTVYTNNKWHSLPASLSSELPAIYRSPVLTGLISINVDRIAKMGRELMYSISKKYVLLVCKTDFEQKWLHTTAGDPFVPRALNRNVNTNTVGKPPKDRRGNKPTKSIKLSKSATFADKVDSIAVLIHNNCVFNWVMFNELLSLIKSDKIRIKSKCIDLMYSSFMEVLPLRKLRYFNEQDTGVLEYLSSRLESSNWLTGEGLNFADSKFDIANKDLNDKKASTNGTSNRGSKGSGCKVVKGWDLLDFDALNLLLAVSFEDYIKGIYSSYIHELADLMNRGVDFLQKNSSNLVLQMLIQKPEQEDLLLDLIINRLTHKNNKMSSYVFKMLDTLLLNHRDMKSVIVKKIISQLDSLVGRLEVLLGSLINGAKNPDRVGVNGLTGAVSVNASRADGFNRPSDFAVNGNKSNMLESGGQRLTRNSMQKCLKISTRKMLNSMCSELVPILKNIYRFILYVSKLQYNKSDGELVSLLMDNNVHLLLLFTSPPHKMTNGVSSISRASTTYNVTPCQNNKVLNASRGVVISGLYKLDECNRIIKVLLLFTNKLLNHYKKLNLYEDKRGLLITNGIDKNLYNLSRETRSSSITILLLLLLHNIDPVNDSYVNILYENVFNTKLYESSNILKFLSLVEQILDTNKDFTRILIRKLLQMGLCNYNNSINCAIIDLILKYINDGNLWELYLYNSTYNPHLLKSIGNVNSRVTRSSSFKAGSRSDSVGTSTASGSSGFSGQSLTRSGKSDSVGSDSRPDSAHSSSGKARSIAKAAEDRTDGDISVNVTNRSSSRNVSSGAAGSARHSASRASSAPKVRSAPANRPGLYDELNVFSRCSKVDYAFERYWDNSKPSELHQKSFELYYKAKWNVLNSKISYDASTRLLNFTAADLPGERGFKRKLECDTKDTGSSRKDSKLKVTRRSAAARDVKSTKKANASSGSITNITSRAIKSTTTTTTNSSTSTSTSSTSTSSSSKSSYRTLTNSPSGGSRSSRNGQRGFGKTLRPVEVSEDSDATSDVEIAEPRDDSVNGSSDYSDDTDSEDSSDFDDDSDYTDDY